MKAHTIAAIVATASIAVASVSGAAYGSATPSSVRWQVQASPNPGPTSTLAAAELVGVSCPAANMCLAAGDAYFLGDYQARLLERWDGHTWKIVNTPVPSQSMSDAFNDVTCASASDCFAIGQYVVDPTIRPFIDHWNGTSWTVQQPPAVSGRSVALSKVACITVGNCYVVGQSTGKASDSRRYMIHWSGHAWSIVDTPGPNGSTAFDAMACSSSNNCVVTGHSGAASSSQPFADHWNGSSWSLGYPHTSTHFTVLTLSGVACPTDSYCIAVGRGSSAGASHLAAVTWNGSTWASTATPTPGNDDRTEDTFADVACSSKTNCVAAGSYETNGPPDTQTLAERWDGQRWTIDSTANPNSFPELLDVACSSTGCTAVGSMSGNGFGATLVEHSSH